MPDIQRHSLIFTGVELRATVLRHRFGSGFPWQHKQLRGTPYLYTYIAVSPGIMNCVTVPGQNEHYDACGTENPVIALSPWQRPQALHLFVSACARACARVLCICM